MWLEGTSGGNRIGVQCSTALWRDVLTLADLSGWKPAGTEAPAALKPIHAGWDGKYPLGYLTNDFQFVTPKDASALADALERMLPDVPLEPIITPHVPISSWETLREAAIAPFQPENCPQGLADAFQRLAGRRALILEIISLCRAGGFAIC